MKRDFADAFMTRGIVKIGTLREYQDVEKYGDAIGDDWEGRSKISHYGSMNGALAKRLIAPWRSQIVNCHSYEPGPSMSVGSRSHDYYIYCATKQFSREAMNAFKCDTCIVIKNYHAFFCLISEVLERRFNILRAFEARSVLYEQKHFDSRTLESLEGRPEWLLKDKDYSYQKEFRARWTPKGSRKLENLAALPPLVIPELRRLEGIEMFVRYW